ncbi:hypothetical protein B5G04_15520 [Bacteroides sp. An51A]|nr:hypothetical protein B5G04_15520 [Bacteroides sp. An51A]
MKYISVGGWRYIQTQMQYIFIFQGYVLAVCGIHNSKLFFKNSSSSISQLRFRNLPSILLFCIIFAPKFELLN